MFYDNLMSLGIKAVCNPSTQKILNKIFCIYPNDFTLGFKKVNRKWYSDIKNWPKAYEEHQLMVAGADKLLEELSNGKNYVTLQIKKEPFPNSIHLTKIEEDEWGGAYKSDRIDYTVWLCNVTKFVFGEHPENIYFKVIKRQ